jgi:hypothetical protein
MRIIGPVQRVALQLPRPISATDTWETVTPLAVGPRDAAQQADRIYTAVMAKESNSSPNVPLTKQAAGAVTGAVAGSIVAGPAGAIVGGVAGAVMGNRVGQGKPAVPTKAVAAATSVAKQVSRIPVGKAVGALTAKAGVLRKTTKKTAAKKTSARKTNAKKAASRTAAKKSVSRRAARSRSAKKSVRR